MKMTIEMIPECEIVYFRKIGPYGIGNIETMAKLKTWASVNGLLNDESIILGIPQDNPAMTKPEACRYDAGLLVSSEPLINDKELQKGKIATGEYAVFEIDHTAEAMNKAWQELFLELSRRGYEIDHSKPVMERYAYKMVENHKCEICVPIC
ncbi:MAG: GyrI-like domain-containing protein [Acetobacterium woodii]|nr:GyrI-like domain-containing protein [Acetobacterium woodii]